MNRRKRRKITAARKRQAAENIRIRFLRPALSVNFF